MSLSSPPDRRQRGEHSSDAPQQDARYESPLRRLYNYASAPFTLGDGRGRLRVLLICALFVFSLFAARLVDLQIVRGDQVAAVAKKSRTVTVTQPAERGRIYDASGVALAQSVPARDITADPYIIDNPQDYAKKLAPIVGLPEANIVKSLQRRTNAEGKELHFAYIARKVDMDSWAKIRDLKLSGLYSEPASLRVYPSGPLAANVLGYVNAENDGVAGIEAEYQDLMAGEDGMKTFERSATGGEIPTGTGNQVDPVAGASVQLSINRDLQWIAQQQVNQSIQRFDAQSAVVVAMDPKTGRILALAQSPTSDPNDPNRRADFLENYAVAQSFDPGSTGKVLTAAAVIEEGKADAYTVFKVPNRLPRKNGDSEFLFRDDVDHPEYEMTFAGVLAQSSNIGTIQAAELIGPEKLYEYMERFGLGQPSGLNMPGENPGLVRPLDQWDDLTFPNVAYGQGYSVNAVQMASVFATVANGGVHVDPRIVDSIIRPDGSVDPAPASEERRVISEETTKKLIPMMEQVVQDRGTAQDVAVVPGYRVAGKTGTAQLYDPNANGGTGGYKGYVSSFIGFAPADDPKLVVAVITRDPKKEYFGSQTGGPVFKAVMTAAMQMMEIPPSGTQAPKLPFHTTNSTHGGPWNW